MILKTAYILPAEEQTEGQYNSLLSKRLREVKGRSKIYLSFATISC